MKTIGAFVDNIQPQINFSISEKNIVAHVKKEIKK